MPASLARMGESGLRSGDGRAPAESGSRERRSSLPPLRATAARSPVRDPPGHRSHQRLQGTCLSSRARGRCARDALAHARVHQPAPADAQAAPPLRRTAARSSSRIRRASPRTCGASPATRTPVRVIYNAVDLERFSPRGAGGRSRCARRACPGAAGHGPGRPGRDLQPVEGPRHVPARRRGAARVAAHPAPTSSAARSTTPTAASTRRSSCAGSPRRTASPTASASPVSSTRPTAAMRALDVVVHASTSPEPFGLVIAEAMACGRALVTSAAGGAAELVRDGEDALTHRPGNAPGSRGGDSRRWPTDAALRERLGQAARTAAVTRFDARRLAGDFATAYEEAARTGGGSRMNGVITAGDPAGRTAPRRRSPASRTPWGFPGAVRHQPDRAAGAAVPARHAAVPSADPVLGLRHQPRGVRVVADAVSSIGRRRTVRRLGRRGHGAAGDDAVEPVHGVAAGGLAHMMACTSRSWRRCSGRRCSSARPEHLARLLGILLICCGINSIVGVLQVYDPGAVDAGRALPRRHRERHRAWRRHVQRAERRTIVRPPGLFDTPGAVAGPGMFAALLGRDLRPEPDRDVEAGRMRSRSRGAGLAAIYLSQVRISLVVTLLMFGIYAATLVAPEARRQGDGIRRCSRAASSAPVSSARSRSAATAFSTAS